MFIYNKFHTIAVILLSFSVGVSNAQDGCEDILLHGIRDEYNILTWSDFQSQLIETLDLTKEGLKRRKIKAEGGGLIPTDYFISAIFRLSGKYEKQRLEKITENYRKNQSVSNEDLVWVAYRITSESIVKAWSECINAKIEAGRSGLQSKVLEGDDPRDLVFMVRWSPEYELPNPIIYDFYVKGARYETLILEPGKTIEKSWMAQPLNREGDGQVVITLNTKGMGAIAEIIPPRKPPHKPGPEPPPTVGPLSLPTLYLPYQLGIALGFASYQASVSELPESRGLVTDAADSAIEFAISIISHDIELDVAKLKQIRNSVRSSHYSLLEIHDRLERVREDFQNTLSHASSELEMAFILGLNIAIAEGEVSRQQAPPEARVIARDGLVNSLTFASKLGLPNLVSDLIKAFDSGLPNNVLHDKIASVRSEYANILKSHH